MHIQLTPKQLMALRRCRRGLNLFEVGDERDRLIAQLDALAGLGLVRFDEARGYETTASGEAWLLAFDE